MYAIRSYYVPQIVALVERLIARGLAYESAGDVYYSVEKFAGYSYNFV